MLKIEFCLQELEYDLYDYECHEYDTDATTTWLATTSAEADEDTSYHVARPEIETSISWPLNEEKDPLTEDIQQFEEEDSPLLESPRCEDEKQKQPRNKSSIPGEKKIPPVACLDDLEVWDG